MHADGDTNTYVIGSRTYFIDKAKDIGRQEGKERGKTIKRSEVW